MQFPNHDLFMGRFIGFCTDNRLQERAYLRGKVSTCTVSGWKDAGEFFRHKNVNYAYIMTHWASIQGNNVSLGSGELS